MKKFILGLSLIFIFQEVSASCGKLLNNFSANYSNEITGTQTACTYYKLSPSGNNDGCFLQWDETQPLKQRTIITMYTNKNNDTNTRLNRATQIIAMNVGKTGVPEDDTYCLIVNPAQGYAIEYPLLPATTVNKK